MKIHSEVSLITNSSSELFVVTVETANDRRSFDGEYDTESFINYLKGVDVLHDFVPILEKLYEKQLFKLGIDEGSHSGEYQITEALLTAMNRTSNGALSWDHIHG